MLKAANYTNAYVDVYITLVMFGQFFKILQVLKNRRVHGCLFKKALFLTGRAT